MSVTPACSRQSWTTCRRSARPLVGAVPSPMRSTLTRRTTAAPTGRTCGGVGSPRGLPAVGLSRRAGWGGIGGGSSARCRGCRGTGGLGCVGIVARSGGLRSYCWRVRLLLAPTLARRVRPSEHRPFGGSERTQVDRNAVAEMPGGRSGWGGRWSVPRSGREMAKAVRVGVLGLGRGAALARLDQQAGMRSRSVTAMTDASKRGPHSAILSL